MPDREKVIKGLEVCIDREPGKYDCYKCPYETDGNDCEINLSKDALALLKEQETGGWISVKDRMPEVGDLVLVAFDVDIGLGETREVNTAMNIEGVFLGGGLANFLDFKCAFKCVMDVTHWMPLPKPPKEG